MAPEQQLRAYVDYLRDMGIYDLYRRQEPQTLLTREVRAKLTALPAPTPVAPPGQPSRPRGPCRR